MPYLPLKGVAHAELIFRPGKVAVQPRACQILFFVSPNRSLLVCEFRSTENTETPCYEYEYYE